MFYVFVVISPNPPSPSYFSIHGSLLWLLNDLKTSPSISVLWFAHFNCFRRCRSQQTRCMATQSCRLLFVRLPTVILFVSARNNLHKRCNQYLRSALPLHTSLPIISLLTSDSETKWTKLEGGGGREIKIPLFKKKKLADEAKWIRKAISVRLRDRRMRKWKNLYYW